MTFHDITKHCKQCGKELVLKTTRDIERKNFCSHACRQRWRYAQGDTHFDEIRWKSYTPENIRKRNRPKGPKQCLHCGQSFDPDSARQNYCKTCVPDKGWRHRMQRYNISKPEWDRLLEQQNGTCALCDDFPTTVDHCHDTGRVRGLLCHCCNMVLARVEDGWYIRAQAYLTRH